MEPELKDKVVPSELLFLASYERQCIQAACHAEGLLRLPHEAAQEGLTWNLSWKAKQSPAELPF